MKNNFSKNPLWAVVFAAAAIFAVTFVACDNGSTTNVYNGLEAGSIAVWEKLGGTEADYVYEHILATNTGGIFTGAGSDYYKLMPEKNIPASSVKTSLTAMTGDSAALDIYEVTDYSTGSKVTTYASGAALATHAASGLYVLGEKVATGVAGVGSTGGIANKTDATAATDIYKLTAYTAAGGAEAVSYLAGDALAAATVTATEVYVLGEKVATGVAGVGSTGGIANKTDATAATDIYKLTAYTAAGGEAAVSYLAGDALAAATVTTTEVYVLGEKVATGVAGVGSTGGIANKTDATAATDIYKLTAYTAAGGDATVSYLAGDALAAATVTTTKVYVLGDKVAAFGEYVIR